jgi:hypothetical protein
MRRTVLWIIASLVFLAAAAECASYVANYRAAAKARSLLKDVRSLQPGRSTLEQVQQIVRRYGATNSRFWLGQCESMNPYWKPYATTVQSTILNRLGEFDRMHDSSLRQFGANQWIVAASFGVDQQGRLSCINIDVRSVPLRHDAVDATAHYSRPYSSSDTRTYGVGYSGVHAIRALGAGATTNATPEQVKHLFDFDLSCLTQMGGCKAVCKVMPAAWRDYRREARQKKLALTADQLREWYGPGCDRLQ